MRWQLEIGEEQVQSFAEANFGRALTPIELHRLEVSWYDDEDTNDEKMMMLMALITHALNEVDIDWSETDKFFENKLKQPEESV